VRAFRSLAALEYLRELGVVPAAVVVGPVTAVDELIERYRRYLLLERGLTPASAWLYVRTVRPFVDRFAVLGGLELERVTPAQVLPRAARVDEVGRTKIKPSDYLRPPAILPTSAVRCLHRFIGSIW
jgi:hypothetical protein